VIRSIGLGLVLSACGPDHAYNAACRNIAINVCTHQVACEIESDVFVCQTEFEATYSCDPSATVEALETCSQAAKALECPNAVPFLCFDVLCSEVAGCGATSTPDPVDTGDTDPP
jgi:hypothetical protein